MEELQVILSPECQKQIEEFTQEVPQQVIGGILLGQFSNVSTGLQITINGVIRALHKESFLKEIHFDHQIWREVYRLKSIDYPGHEIVGWFHTCPGKPLIPGDQDYSIQKAFFQEPHKVLLLIDPLNSQSCIFYWQKNFLVPYADFMVDTEQATNIANEITYVEQSNFREIALEAQEILKQSSNISINIGSMLENRVSTNEVTPSSTGIGTGIDTVISPEMSSTMSTGLKVIAAIATLLTIIIFIMYPVIRPLSPHLVLQATEETAPNKQVATIVEKPQAKTNEQVLSTNQTTQTVNEPSKLLNTPNKKATKTAERIYTIQPGDSLWNISSQFYGNGFDFFKIIRANNIINPNSLQVGTVLVVPE